MGWAAVAVRLARRQLRAGRLEATLPRPPVVNAFARRGARGVIRRLEPTCLERSLVLQRWLSAAGAPREVVIGVRRDVAEGFAAHAWVDGETVGTEGFHELRRIPAPPP